ncbi:hypothetical protein GLOIN_2v1776040 [Rhizophagus irregularis DAOM 181602=DAOM 197198]|uniref:Myb-like transcription factor n=1 Tax=Rhizophagus irregularis (strain DAOM 181602 / DAOM 197198 / MUCL 43194) TaxID=747089 RepID=A0A2P4PY26_RHIID|nr:hypothetical protein GLOIN_2v1776040 [Rhizophagus irregularis DAOM 181602=DAOM 197198]POG70284.1 hypothetical protein GLOIN_2v1776040 [Rhizophagus irregularis DAOM 181602=DAOM 197198]|eukprot:XP_025177150.1 hypothetical protein GLOIN_2v1776040 [Rhizophagus irregularis DAOM 181602=DAOM 197198]
MPYPKKLCNQKNIAFFNQVRLFYIREVCYNESFHKPTFYINNTKGNLNFFERTFSTKNEIDNVNIVEETEELKDLSGLREFSNDKDRIIEKDNRGFRAITWSRLETKVLDNLVEKYGKSWETISQYMFDKTPQECKVQYEKIRRQQDSNFSYQFMDLPEFTDDEIDQINILIQKNGRNWRRIAKLFPDKSSLDIERFVKDNSDRFPSLYSDPIFIKRYKGSTWTDNDLKSLNELLMKHGRNLDAISQELPHRTPKSIERAISKHMLDLPALHSGKVADWFRSSTIWSESETRSLNELVEIYGFNWEKISEYLPGRSPLSCSSKFYASWSTWNNKVTALVPHKWPKEVIQFLDLLIEKYGKWQILPILVSGMTPANWFSPFSPQSRVWTISEKQILQYLIKTNGYNWEKISEYFPHRQRWTIIREVLGNIEDYGSTYSDENVSTSNLINSKKRKRRSFYWPYEEVKKLYELKEKYSSNWYKISEELPGRAPAACYLKDFVLLNARKKINYKLDVLEICHLQELLRYHGSDWEAIASHIKKDPNEIKDIVNEYPEIFPSVLFGLQIKNTANWTEKEKELLKNLIASQGNNWKFIKKFFPKKSYQQIFDYYYKHLEDFPDNLNKNYRSFYRAFWNKEENELLKELLQKHGNNFEYISQYFPGRTSLAIKTHIRNYPELFYSENEQNYRIDAKYKKDQKRSNMSWTKYEEDKLLALTKSYPVDWNKIAAEFPSRTIHACKAKYRDLKIHSFTRIT